ncbi:TetR/AcrR family transcriptional regulator [Halarsenatibacter silvermanii]|uniref:DNA-binding transcriptional regulator, AcrR family n=1 Tax=Halarsenatibacter silvermanii TaxID=321763 RepID=A0A1G9KZX9_9FIRM|nr:TetR/AcrR family transcriptional regulator [Halarsenatibacter silvermanii]SDL55104.1 DNA-binding transcriptional regulator, AcrR family [Halarsenatibacter silvermanii]
MSAERPEEVKEDELQGEDGRKSRKSRNRRKVLDAFLQLIEKNSTLPSPEKIAEEAEVSRRSIFRYFENLDQLVAEAYHHQIELLREKFSPPKPIELSEEIERKNLKNFVSYLSSVYEYTASIRKVLSEKGLPADVRKKLNRMRSQTLKNRLAQHFGKHMEEKYDAERMEDLLYGLETALSPESWDYLRGPCGLSRERACRVWIEMLIKFIKN